MGTLAQKYRDEGINLGREEGINLGKNELSRHIAISMINDNEPIAKVIRYTGLSEKQILQLKNSSQ